MDENYQNNIEKLSSYVAQIDEIRHQSIPLRSKIKLLRVGQYPYLYKYNRFKEIEEILIGFEEKMMTIEHDALEIYDQIDQVKNSAKASILDSHNKEAVKDLLEIEKTKVNSGIPNQNDFYNHINVTSNFIQSLKEEIGDSRAISYARLSIIISVTLGLLSIIITILN